MAVVGKRRVTRSGAEWAELFERFGASGMSGAAFCEREEISKSSFARWKRLIDGRTVAPTGEFVEWRSPAAAPTAGALSSGELELSFPGGVRLRFRP
jgi:hypothetical protein